MTATRTGRATVAAEIPVRIRIYRSADHAAVRSLWQECGSPAAQNTPLRAGASVVAPFNMVMLVAIDSSERLIGAIVVDHDSRCGRINAIMITPTFRRRRIATALVRDAETWLSAQGIPRAGLLVDPGDPAVGAFWRSLDYEPMPRAWFQRVLSRDTRAPVTVYHLGMTAPPAPGAGAAPRPGLAVVQARQPTLRYYRFLYDSVGGPWHWTDRRALSDDELAAVIHDPRVEIHVLTVNHVPAGFFELDRRQPNTVELAYFGLMPEFIGQGLGAWLLRRAVALAWGADTRRVTVHTCSLDHPKALGTYLTAGFVEARREIRSFQG
ncbi:MAG: GNAT family N-acetyltransferase [Azospirillaceae bacterium]|nr:GNAT family N-acetyltransferase [Azospirillaceae bacterium]